VAAESTLKPGEDYYKVRHEIDPDFFVVCTKRKTAPAVKKAFVGHVCYTPNELRILAKAGDMEATKKAHLIKKVFPGAFVHSFTPGGKEKIDAAKA
jgi:hypothetical protein